MPEKPVLLDANAVLRYLLEDNDEQADEVCQAVASGAEVTLEVLAGNAPAIALYERLGFRIVHTVSGRMPGNEAFAVTVHEMQREG